MPSNRSFCTAYKQYCFPTNFITNRLRAPYKTCKFYKVNPLFTFLTYYLSNSIYIGEKRYTVPITFSGPPAAYKLNYSRYCFRYYFRRCFFPYTARINLAATIYINPAATYYCPPYCRAARSWFYYYPPYYGAARS
jgi:hypothetical protein